MQKRLWLYLENGSLPVGLFDFDGNIINTGTPTLLRNKETWRIEEIPCIAIDQNQEDFFWKKSKYELITNEIDDSFMHYLDFHVSGNHLSPERLLGDVREAIEKGDLASSFHSFKEIFLIPARVFAIISARGNCPDNFARALNIICDACLSKEEKESQKWKIRENFNVPKDTNARKYYIENLVYYIPCSNIHTAKMWGLSGSGKERKVQAMKQYLPHAHKILSEAFGRRVEEILSPHQKLSVGLSDDSLQNVLAMIQWMQELYRNNIYPNHKYRIYYTWLKEIQNIDVLQNGVVNWENHIEIRFWE